VIRVSLSTTPTRRPDNRYNRTIGSIDAIGGLLRPKQKERPFYSSIPALQFAVLCVSISMGLSPVPTTGSWVRFSDAPFRRSTGNGVNRERGQQGTGSTGTGVHRRGQQGHPYSNCLHFANWVSSEHFVFAQRSAVACREILSRTRSHCWLATREADRSVLSQSDPPAGAKQSTARHCCRSPRR